MDSQKGLKFILLGESGVGKTCIMLRFVGKPIRVSRISTIGIDKEHRTFDVDGKSVQVDIWDTAGQEKYRGALPRNIFNRIHGALLVFDVSNRKTFDSIHTWMEIIKSQAPENAQTILVANKIDLPHIVSKTEAEDVAKDFGIPLIMTSAKEGNGIDEAFSMLIKASIEKNPWALEDKVEDILTLDNNKKGKRNCC